MGVFRKSLFFRIMKIILFVAVAGVCLFLLLRGLIHANIVG